jgi:hypothetical protein
VREKRRIKCSVAWAAVITQNIEIGLIFYGFPESPQINARIFIHGSFNNTVSSTDYIVSDDTMISEE